MSLTAIVSRLATNISPPQHCDALTDAASSPSSSSSSSAASTSLSPASPSPLRSAMKFDTQSIRSVATASSSSEPSPSHGVVRPPGVRANEHLAVLLPKHLWKPDSQASRCDIFLCRKRFSIFERRHHCRKCGGVFCAECSTRSTALLDTSTLEFLNPPRNVAISTFASPTSPVLDARVCDACWDQIHGVKRSSISSGSTSAYGASSSTSNQASRRTAPISVHWETDSASSSASASPHLPPTPLDGSALITPTPRPPHRRTTTSSSSTSRTPMSPLRSGVSTPTPGFSIPLPDFSSLSPLSNTPPPTPTNELDAYPLCVASAICKATGGGRWEPKAFPDVARMEMGWRMPGCKAPYEIELEREEEEVRRWKRNPVIVDGEFQVRAPREMEPHSLAGPFTLSTF